MFHAVLDYLQLEGSHPNMTVQTLRQLVVEKLRAETDTWNKLWSEYGPGLEKNYDSCEAYIEAMQKDDEWGDCITLFLLGDILDRKIFVWTDRYNRVGSDDTYLLVSVPALEGLSTATILDYLSPSQFIHVYFDCVSHYQHLKPKRWVGALHTGVNVDQVRANAQEASLKSFRALCKPVRATSKSIVFCPLRNNCTSGSNVRSNMLMRHLEKFHEVAWEARVSDFIVHSLGGTPGALVEDSHPDHPGPNDVNSQGESSVYLYIAPVRLLLSICACVFARGWAYVCLRVGGLYGWVRQAYCVFY